MTGTGNINQLFSNSGNILEPVVFHITATAAGCSTTTPTNYIVNINPVPLVTSSPVSPQMICSGNNTQPVFFQNNLVGLPVTYSWTAHCDPVIAGCLPPTGNANPINSFSPTNPSSSQKTITINILAALPATNSSCLSQPNVYSITVNPLPVSTFSGVTTVCQLTSTPYLYMTASGPSCSYNWSITPFNAGTNTNTTGSTASIIWNVAGSATLSLAATTSSGCITNATQSISINPRPDVSFSKGNNLMTTKNARPIRLRGGLPLGNTGEYMGTGVQEPVAGTFLFDPTVTAVSGSPSGTPYTIIYRYTNRYLCSNEATGTIRVFPSNATEPCPGSVSDVRDNGRSYRTKLFGNGAGMKCWMAENLDYGIMIGMNLSQRDNSDPEKYCINDLSSSCSDYGGLYQWDELVQYNGSAAYQDICPPGWRLPVENEWISMMNYYNGNALAGSFLKDTVSTGGFEGLLRGVVYLNNRFSFVAKPTQTTFFWTANPVTPDKAVAHGLNLITPSVSSYQSSRANAFPVRCVRN
jgi:uncharacterized protein (TIGR02145 family)